MKYIITLLFCIGLVLGARAQSLHTPSERARQLNDTAVTRYIRFGTKPDSVKAAIKLLDRAVALDSLYYNAWTNKLGFECQAGQFDKALKTTNRMVRLFPSEFNVLFFNGILQFKNGHNKEATAIFSKLLKLYDSIPQAKEDNDNLKTIQINKSIALLLLDRKKEGEDILKALGAKEHDPAVKHYLTSYIGRSKADIINDMLPGK